MNERCKSLTVLRLARFGRAGVRVVRCEGRRVESRQHAHSSLFDQLVKLHTYTPYDDFPHSTNRMPVCPTSPLRVYAFIAAEIDASLNRCRWRLIDVLARRACPSADVYARPADVPGCVPGARQRAWYGRYDVRSGDLHAYTGGSDNACCVNLFNINDLQVFFAPENTSIFALCRGDRSPTGGMRRSLVNHRHTAMRASRCAIRLAPAAGDRNQRCPSTSLPAPQVLKRRTQVDSHLSSFSANFQNTNSPRKECSV